MSKLIKVSVEIGYELHTITLENEEWKRIKNGERFTKELESYYEGEAFTYIFDFNNKEPNNPNITLVVTYDDADGFIGNIEDAIVNEEE
jgi:hypothetical protein